jgi:hypothetical protein
MDDLEPEVLLEGIEVAVAVKQRMSFEKAKGRNQAVDRFADGMAALPEEAVVLCRGNRQIFSTGPEDGELQQFAASAPECCFVADTLQDLAKDEVSQAEWLGWKFAFEPTGVRVYCSAQIINPNCGVDDGHGRRLLCRAA